MSQGSASGNDENSWRLSLDETTPVDLHVNLGAGDLVLDLRGTPARSYSVNVEAGAGDTTIHLPGSVGISARTSGLIGDVNVSGLEKRDGRWISARAEGSSVTIDLSVQHAIGDLRVLAE